MRKWIPRILVAAASLVLLAALTRAFFMFLKYDWTLVTFPYPVDYGEGPILDQVMRISRFQNIYRPNPTELPFTISNYPPAYHLAQLPFAWIFGAAYWYGRGISMLSILAAGLLIGLTIHALTQDRLAAIFGSLTLFAIPYILHWSAFCRVDSFALALSLGGLYAIARHPHTRSGLIVSAILLTAAIYTRQSYGLAAPFAAFIWLISQKPRWQALRLAIWVGGLSGVLFILLNLLTRGNFYFNIITANVNPFFWDTVKNYAKAMWEHLPYLLISSGIFFVGAVWFKVKSWWLIAPYLLAGAASAVTIGKDGSNVNYLYELSAAWCLAAGAILALGQKRWWLRVPLILLLAGQLFFVYDWTKQDHYRWPMNRANNERTEIAQMLEIVKSAQGPVLADEFMGLVPLAGKELPFQPFEFKQLAIAQVWDQEPFLESIRQQVYDAILLYDPPNWDSRGARWTKEQLLTIYLNYQEVGRYANTIVLKPYPNR